MEQIENHNRISRYDVVITLHRASKPLDVYEMSQRLNADYTSISAMCRNLRKEGIIANLEVCVRHGDSKDAITYFYALTKEGRKLGAALEKFGEIKRYLARFGETIEGIEVKTNEKD